MQSHNPLNIIWTFRPFLYYWFHSCLNVISVTLPHIDQLNIHMTSLLLLACIPYIILQPISQLDIHMTSILLLSSLIWFMSPCNPLPNLTFRQLPYYCFHPLYYFWNPATYWPVEHSGNFYIINYFFIPYITFTTVQHINRSFKPRFHLISPILFPAISFSNYQIFSA